MLTYRGTRIPTWFVALTIALPILLTIVLILLD